MKWQYIAPEVASWMLVDGCCMQIFLQHGVVFFRATIMQTKISVQPIYSR